MSKTHFKYGFLQAGFIILFAFLTLPGIVSGQVLKATARLDSSKILIGDQIRLHLDLDLTNNAKVNIPVFKDTIMDKIEILQMFKDSTRNTKGIHIHQSYLITCFEGGTYHLKGFQIPVQVGSFMDTLKTQSLELKVFSLPVDTTKEIKDIKSPLKIKFSFKEIWNSIKDMWKTIALCLGIALIILGLIAYFIIRKKGNIFKPSKPKLPSHIVALQELDKLRSEKLWQNDKVKLYYTRLTQIIRIYIEARFEILALEMTSDEIIDAMLGLQLDDKQPIEFLRQIFSVSDLVKFAKAQPLLEENEIALLNAYQFVNNTKPVEKINLEENNQTPA